MLASNITAEEVHRAVFQLKAFKVPGPDGLPAEFFYKYWAVLKDDIISMIQNFSTSGFLLKEFNRTFISLIPKSHNPESIRDFRPIGLCNTVYKIIAKILVNRLLPFINSWISPNQNGFIKGRQIADNIILTSELMNYIYKSK